MAKTHRKKHVAPAVTFNPLTALYPMEPERRQHNMGRLFTAVDAMRRGCATSTEWTDVSDAINQLNVLMDWNEIDEEQFADPVDRASAAMVFVRMQAKPSDDGCILYPLSDDGYAAMREVLAIYETVLERKTWMVVWRAHKEAQKRIKDKRSQRSAHVKEVA